MLCTFLANSFRCQWEQKFHKTGRRCGIRLTTSELLDPSLPSTRCPREHCSGKSGPPVVISSSVRLFADAMGKDEIQQSVQNMHRLLWRRDSYILPTCELMSTSIRIDASWILLAYSLLFPTCQVRVVRFYVRSSPHPPPTPLPPLLLPSASSVPCQTSTSVPCRTSTARQKIGHIERQKECQKRCHKECETECQKRCQKECQKDCQKMCQKDCQKECQKRCQNMPERLPEAMPDRMSERLSGDMQGMLDRMSGDMQRMSERCQTECQKICRKECQEICKENQTECQKRCQKKCQKIR